MNRFRAYELKSVCQSVPKATWNVTTHRKLMKTTGSRNARNGVDNQCRTKAMRRFLTVRAAIWRGRRAMSTEDYIYDSLLNAAREYLSK